MLAEVKNLYQLLETCTDDNLRLKLLFNIANCFLDFDERRVLETAEQLKALAEQLDSHEGRAYYYSIRGRLLIKKAHYAESGVAFSKALEHALLTPDLFIQAMCYDSLGIQLGYQYQYAAALEACFKAFEIYDRINHDSAFRFKLVCCNHIAVTYLIMYDIAKAEQYFLLGLQLLGDGEVGAIKPTLQNNLANAKNIKGEYAESMAMAQVALNGYEQHHHKNGIAHANLIIARNYLGLGEAATALAKLQQVLKLLKGIDNKVVQIKALSSLGEVYMQMEAFNEALKYFQKALKVATTIGDEHKVCSNKLLLGKAWLALHQPEKALNALKEGKALAQKYHLAHELAELEAQMMLVKA